MAKKYKLIVESTGVSGSINVRARIISDISDHLGIEPKFGNNDPSRKADFGGPGNKKRVEVHSGFGTRGYFSIEIRGYNHKEMYKLLAKKYNKSDLEVINVAEILD